MGYGPNAHFQREDGIKEVCLDLFNQCVQFFDTYGRLPGDGEYRTPVIPNRAVNDVAPGAQGFFPRQPPVAGHGVYAPAGGHREVHQDSRQPPVPGHGVYAPTGGHREVYQDPGSSRYVGEFTYQIPGPGATVTNTMVSGT